MTSSNIWRNRKGVRGPSCPISPRPNGLLPEAQRNLPTIPTITWSAEVIGNNGLYVIDKHVSTFPTAHIGNNFDVFQLDVDRSVSLTFTIDETNDVCGMYVLVFFGPNPDSDFSSGALPNDYTSYAVFGPTNWTQGIGTLLSGQYLLQMPAGPYPP